MQLRLILPVLTFLVGCPSPPDDAKAGPGGGGGPKGAPPAAKADAPAPKAPADGAPPEGAAAPGGDAPPPGDGAPGGEGKAPGAPGDGSGAKGPPPEGGEPQAEPAVGFGPGHDDNNPGGKSIVTVVTATETGKDDGDIDQETVRKMEADKYAVFRGEARCDGCSGDLILRAVPYFAPDSQLPDGVPGTLTHMKLDGPGAFEFAVPDRDVNVVIELLVDKNKDGRPTKGERFAVLENRGGFSAKKPMSGLVVDASSSAKKQETTDKLVPGTPSKPEDAQEGK